MVRHPGLSGVYRVEGMGLSGGWSEVVGTRCKDWLNATQAWWKPQGEGWSGWVKGVNTSDTPTVRHEV